MATKFKENLKYKCIATYPIMVRRKPDDKAQTISVVRPNEEVICLDMYDGIIHKIPAAKSVKSKDIWMKISKGYVRVVSLNGKREHFVLAKIKEQYTVCTEENTKAGDIVMVSKGAVNSFGRKPNSEDFYAPTTHEVLAIDGTGRYLYIGKNMQSGVWYNMNDCVLVKKGVGNSNSYSGK